MITGRISIAAVPGSRSGSSCQRAIATSRPLDRPSLSCRWDGCFPLQRVWSMCGSGVIAGQRVCPLQDEKWEHRGENTRGIDMDLHRPRHAITVLSIGAFNMNLAETLRPDGACKNVV